MPKTKITDYSATRADNADIDGINIAEGCPAANINDMGREFMVQLAETNAGTYPVADTWSFADPADLTKIVRLDAGSIPTATSHAINAAWLQRKSADIASATTTDLSTATGGYIDITGTTTITGLGTVAAGVMFVLQFDSILTFTHNGTSLILPGAANITTAAGDVAVMVSEGSGNWRCVSYQQYSEGVVESGTWTPTLRFGGGTTGITYSLQKGRYVKRGKVCTAFCYIVLTSKGSSTGSATLAGLPFTAATESGFFWSASVAYNNIGSALSVLLPSGSSNLAIYNLTSAMDNTDFLDSAELMFTLTYEVA